MQTDASGIGMAAVLYHFNAKFKGAEKNYQANEAECYAVVWAIKRHRPYLEHQQFILRTDSRSLTWLESVKENKQKLVRWALLLQEYDFEIQHVAGKANELPDFLSRNSTPGEEHTENIEEAIEKLVILPLLTHSPKCIDQALLTQVENPCTVIEEHQRQDAEIRTQKTPWRNLGVRTPDITRRGVLLWLHNEDINLFYKVDGDGG